ncbi:hypothetical protein QJS10_CPB11g01278 [Acorus calamus]|uniref:Uncharacterized protein n=1 Tax=Acorus calamus TaxID=4465 RepID=A0AAV9DU21_ACOCL|nr:hypothetical protein QJS10_CPB11g01278 [Acorus calamus]
MASIPCAIQLHFPSEIDIPTSSSSSLKRDSIACSSFAMGLSRMIGWFNRRFRPNKGPKSKCLFRFGNSRVDAEAAGINGGQIRDGDVEQNLQKTT